MEAAGSTGTMLSIFAGCFVQPRQKMIEVALASIKEIDEKRVRWLWLDVELPSVQKRAKTSVAKNATRLLPSTNG